jgi:hypothetical protein
MSDIKIDLQHPLMTRSFRDRESAERAYNDIAARGSLKGAGVGGAVGGVVGATVVGLAAAAAAVTVPVLGLVIVGPLAGALVGGTTGATAGGIVGMMVGAGIPEARAKEYETELKQGGIVLGVKPRHDEDARYFETEWQGQQVKK